jgi:hydroxymethylpyrimidine/phosphomethylpyrimidine kinase
MTVAGSDSGGGAGIQADLATFNALGVHGASAITCLTAQNPDSVTDVFPATGDFVREQMDQVGRYFPIAALKSGMLFSAEIIRSFAGFLRENPSIQTVIDPVMVATSGAVLLQPDAIEAVKTELLPLATIITPNLDEVAVLLAERPADLDGMIAAGGLLAAEYGCAVLMKGGHLEGDRVTDALVTPSGHPRIFEFARVSELNTHGSGCIFSAAITAYLARGLPLDQAVGRARAYLQKAMLEAKTLKGCRFINPCAQPPAGNGGS